MRKVQPVRSETPASLVCIHALLSAGWTTSASCDAVLDARSCCCLVGHALPVLTKRSGSPREATTSTMKELITGSQ